MSRKIDIVKNVLDVNDEVALENRMLMAECGCLAVNITSAPGSGKTMLLEKTIVGLGKMRSAVIVGDLQTARDAERVAHLAAAVVQINTEGGCHLSASQVAAALGKLDLRNVGIDFIFIENVGNMVCPSGFDLGEHYRVAMLSTPEGHDKVAKYNTMFQPADVILLNKIDLTEVLDFDSSCIRDDLSKINTRAPLIELSAKTGEGMDKWLAWLRNAKAGLDSQIELP